MLLVEDNARMRAMIKSVVASRAQVVAECASGGEAVELYEQHQPAVVVMDIELEGLDGISATRDICSRHPDARVIMFTSHDDPACRAAALDAGAMDFVLKENVLDLLAVLDAAI